MILLDTNVLSEFMRPRPNLVAGHSDNQSEARNFALLRSSL